ncbi:MAG: hypothetical protein JXQ26_11630 [Tissierellales bacterium]|nr:hypothetical protein [Tissierellales bacterium]MBN2828637.1 hypothetical protein [Tissierellales bacterium]
MELILVVFNALKIGANAVIKLGVIIVPLMMAIEILKDLKILEKFSKLLSPLTRLLKVHQDSSLPLVIGLVLGLFFGAGVLFESVNEGQLDKKSLVVVSIFLALCHAVVEDTLIFIPIKANLMIIIVVRVSVALFVAIVASRMMPELQ